MNEYQNNSLLNLRIGFFIFSLPILFFPIVFTPIGFLVGAFNIKRNKLTHGVVQMFIAALCGVIGFSLNCFR